MTHVHRRRVKRYYSHPCSYLVVGFSFYLIVFASTHLQAWTCISINQSSPKAEHRDEWRYQNSVSGRWYHWQLGYHNEPANGEWDVKWLNKGPSSYLGVIVYLTRRNEIDTLRASLTQLARLLINSPRPVVIFHQGDFNDNATQQSLAQILGPQMPLGFERIEFSNSITRPRSVHRRIPSGYYEMCRFFTLMLPTHPLLTLFQFYWRFDSHSYIFAPAPIQDPFEVMLAQRIQYAFIMVNEEADQYATGLWSLFRKFLVDRCLQSSPALYKTQTGWLGGHSLAMVFTNFAIANVSLFRDHRLIRAWLQTVDDEGGIYRYRWGDAPIHTLALTQFIPRKDIARLRYFGYMHQREYVCAYGTEDQLCREQVQPFLKDPKVEYLHYDDGCYPSTWNPLCHYYREIRS